MKTKIVERDGKHYLAKVTCKERYFYDVEITYIKDGPNKPLVTDNYEVEVEAKSFGELPENEEAMPMLAALYMESNPGKLSEDELRSTEFVYVVGPLVYDEFDEEILCEI